MGICHSYAPDGRCISLLKILLTNVCIFDCRYCINRKSSNVQRARFTVAEVVQLTLDFYRRSEEHTSELQSPCNLVCRLLLEKKKIERQDTTFLVNEQSVPISFINVADDTT